MRKKLQVADLGDLLEQPLNAVLATYLPLGDILLTPVWHEWRGGGFSVIIMADDIKDRNLRRDPRASLVVAEHGGLNRGMVVRAMPRTTRDGVDARQLADYAALFRTRAHCHVFAGTEGKQPGACAS